MRKSLIASCLISVLCVSASAQDGKRRAMTVDDQLNMIGIGDALISPNGRWALFSKSELDWSKNKRKKTYYRVSTSGGDERQYIGEAGGSGFQFSPAGTYLSFLRPVGEGKEKLNQLFLLRVDGGEAVQRSKHKSAVRSYRWSQDESQVFFTADKPRGKEEKKRTKDGYDAIRVDEGPSGQRDGRWRHLWTIDVKSGDETRILGEEIIVGAFDPSPDGRRVVFTARSENRRNQQYLSEIYVVNIQDKLKTRLTDNRVPESSVRWSPDGSKVAYMANDDKEWELRNAKIWVIDPNTREHRIVSSQFVGSIRGFHWSPDGQDILYTGLQRTDSNLFKVNVGSGQVMQLTHSTGTVNVTSLSADQSRFVYYVSNFDTPPDLWAGSLDGGEPRKLTDSNPWIEKELLLAQGKVVQWKSSDGREIEGVLHLPAGHVTGSRVPLMLNIHGGPAGVFTNSFSARYHIYAGLGYASLSPNVRGSSGYSDELLRGNMKDIGGGDYQDLMTGVDALIEQGLVDADRMGLRGWSYGGILGGWTITQTDRFKAASVGAMVSDWTSEYGPGFNHDVKLWYIGGTPWENPDGWHQKSALTHIANVKTPTIIFHGLRDFTDTEPQSMMFFAALKDLGQEVRYLRFPREPHGFREPRHQRTRDIEEITWMQKYILGEEWEPWKREEKKKDGQDAESSPPVEVETGS